MATFAYELNAEARDTFGKGASRRLRRLADKVPGIIYGAESAPTPITLAQNDVKKALAHEGFYSHILTIHNGSQKEKVVLKAVQRHPYKPTILHLDFLRINPKKPIVMHIPLHFLGQDVAPGVKDGGTVTHHMVEVEVKCLPKDLPEFIEIDLTNAPLDTVVHLSQLSLPKGVELTSVVHGSEDDLPVVSIHKPKRTIEEVEEAEVEASAAETEAESDEAQAADDKEGNDK